MSRWDGRERAALVALLRRTTSEKGERESVRRLADETSPVVLLRERLGPDDLFSDPVEEAIAQAREDIASPTSTWPGTWRRR